MAGHSGGGGMIRTILIWMAIALALVLFLLWLIAGGPRKIIESARNIGNPFSSALSAGTSTLSTFRLPWQPDELTRGPIVSAGEDGEEPMSSEDELSATEREYDALQKKIAEARNFGEPSPHRGKITIVEHAADESIDTEYVTLHSTEENTAPIDITSWSLQSAVTGIRGFIPRGANIFTLGAINVQQNISLSPGMTAVISSGFSPVGTSFRENMCSGYLAQMQDFRPSLPNRCPSPADTLPLTADNLRIYGEACYDFVQSLPTCTFPLSAPPEVSGACRAFLVENLSYNGCVQASRYKTAFLHNTWRVFLGAGGDLWRNSHDVVRLLDAEGRTVDVLLY